VLSKLNQHTKNYLHKQINIFIVLKSSIHVLIFRIKAIFEEGLLMLNQYKNIENLSISLTKDNGILSNENYHQILNDITKNKRFLRNLNLKLMDM
jgi:hypothetical protein